MRIIPEKVKAVFSSPSSSSRKRDANNATSKTVDDNSAGRLLDEAENGGGTIELSDAASGLQQHSSSSSPRPNKYVSPEKLLLKSDDDNNNDSSPSAGIKETAAETMAYYNNASSTTPPGEEGVGGDDELINHHQRRNRKEKKKGHKFLFFCCDSKRAVIILNTFMCILSSFVFTMALLNRDTSNSNDDDISAFKQAMIIQGCGIFITFATILGAFWYSISVVCVGLLFTTYQLTMGIIKMTKFHWTYADTNSIVGVLLPVSINILLFYAEGLFISEISDGIMSDETYISRERYSFCCTRCPC
jgi:hypothetical protein